MPNDLIKLRRLMNAANELKKSKPAVLRGAQLNASGALKYAWWFEKFRTQLSTGIYRFSYFKTDGTIREAYGTLCMDYIPDENKPKGTGTEINGNTFAYWDVKALGWRSFRLDNFFGFVEEIK